MYRSVIAIVVVLLVAAGVGSLTGTAYADPLKDPETTHCNANNPHDGGCPRGIEEPQPMNPVCRFGNHTGNPHCEDGAQVAATVTSTATVEANISKEATATVEADISKETVATTQIEASVAVTNAVPAPPQEVTTSVVSVPPAPIAAEAPGPVVEAAVPVSEATTAQVLPRAAAPLPASTGSAGLLDQQPSFGATLAALALAILSPAGTRVLTRTK